MDYRQLATRIAAEEGVDPALVLEVMGAESAGNPGAVSSAGARGLMQLMPRTAAGLGVTDIHDPEQNIRAGVRYLKEQIQTFGSVPLGLAAYNAGPSRVASARGIPNIPETQAYVKTIMGRLESPWSRKIAPPLMAGDPNNMGMDVPSDPRYGADSMYPIGPQQPQGMPMLPGAQQPMDQTQTLLQRMATSPLIQMGLATLAQGGGTAMQQISRGAQQGMMAARMAYESQQKFDATLSKQALDMEAAVEKRRQMLEARQIADQLSDPVMASLYLRSPESFAALQAAGQERGATMGALGGYMGGGGYAAPAGGYGPQPMPSPGQAQQGPIQGQPEAQGQPMGGQPMPAPGGATPYAPADALEAEAQQLMQQAQQFGSPDAAKAAIAKKNEADQLRAKIASDIGQEQRQYQSPQQRMAVGKDVQTRLAPYRSALQNGTQARNMLAIVSGPADVAGITLLVKSLDPTSVVRESESAAYGNASGLYNTLQGQLLKIKSGEKLTPEVRVQMQEIIDSLMVIYQQEGQKEYQKVQGMYGDTYSPESIGLGASPSWTPMPVQAPVQQAPGASGMSAEQQAELQALKSELLGGAR